MTLKENRLTEITENTENTESTEQSATVYNRGFASGGMRDKLETYGILINFMDGLTRREYSSSARCKAPERWAQ